MADIIVIQTPICVELICDNCDEEINIDYQEFTDVYGECCDWGYGQEIKCPHCGYKNLVGNWEFD